MNDDIFEYIMGVLNERADDALNDYEKNPESEFNSGYVCAYHHVLEIIQSRLEAYDYDLSKCGLDIDLDEKFINGPARKRHNKQTVEKETA